MCCTLYVVYCKCYALICQTLCVIGHVRSVIYYLLHLTCQMDLNMFVAIETPRLLVVQRYVVCYVLYLMLYIVNVIR